MIDEDKAKEKLDVTRLNVQAEREATTETREKLQKRRELLHGKRASLAMKVDDGLEQEKEFHRLQDDIQQIQHEILKLQSHSHADQDAINRLRRLADGYGSEILGMAEEKQTKVENIQLLQEYLQRLREDIQRKHEEGVIQESRRERDRENSDR